jgi:tRNA (mo5U34)-methyltransferase
VSNPLPRPSDADLAEINSLLDWHAGTLLPDGRLIGRLERTAGKRPAPAQIPDKRIRILNDLVHLKNKKVLEIGCFEGIHTIGLRQFCEDVTAVDVRPQNVLKTLARLSWHGVSAKVHQYDAEEIGADFPRFDVIFHIGVLYHLANPVQHLLNIGQLCDYLFLDTHVAPNEKAGVSIGVDGMSFSGARHREGGWADPFSGKDKHAIWLTRESVLDVLKHAGFSNTQILQERQERNGPRLLLIAARQPVAPVRAQKKPKKAKDSV